MKSCCGHIAWIKKSREGELRAIDPEAGFRVRLPKEFTFERELWRSPDRRYWRMGKYLGVGT